MERNDVGNNYYNETKTSHESTSLPTYLEMSATFRNEILGKLLISVINHFAEMF